MADYAHQTDPRMMLALERDVNKARFMGTTYKRKMEEDLARRTADRVAYNVQRYLRRNPNPKSAMTKPYVERFAVHRVLNNGTVSMLVAEFIFREEAEEYVKNAMLGRIVFGGTVFDTTKSGLATGGGLGLVGSGPKQDAVVGTKTMSDGSKLMVRIQ